MVSRRELPVEVFGEADWFLWRGVGLDKPLSARLTPEAYEAWTFAPGFVADQELATIRWAVREWEARDEGTWQKSVAYIVGRMRDVGATFVVPDSLAQVTDPGFGRVESEYVTVGQTPYYVVRKPDEASVVTAWRDAASAAGALAVLTVADVPERAATPDDLTRFADSATDVVVEAYDHPQRVVFFSARRLDR